MTNPHRTTQICTRASELLMSYAMHYAETKAETVIPEAQKGRRVALADHRHYIEDLIADGLIAEHQRARSSHD